jgi:flagellar motor switch protein FliM
MEKQLAQESIDALFAAAQASTAASVDAIRNNTLPELYNFSHAGQISNDELRAISLVNDQFARNLMHTMGAWLRTRLEVKLVAGEQLPYVEFVDRLPKPTYVCSIQLEPFDLQGLVELDLALASPIVDVLLGGEGQSAAVRELTDIEEEILASVLKIVVQELNGAWHPVGLQMAFVKRESDSNIQRIMGASEKILCVSFEVRSCA